MYKLTTDQIQEINAALKNVGVYYADIRMELTDHVASTIESEGFSGDIETYVQSHKEEIQQLNENAEAMAMHRNLKAAFIETTKPGFWLVYLSLVALGEIMIRFSDADSAAISTLACAMVVILVAAYNPVFRGNTPEFSGKKHYKIIDRILVVACIVLLNLYTRTEQHQLTIILSATIGAAGYALYAATKTQVAKYKSHYYA